MVAYLLLSERSGAHAGWPFPRVLAAGAPIAALSGILGLGPGFLLMPLMVLAGFSTRRAAAMNAVAVTPSSFASLAPRFAHASIDLSFAIPVVLSAACGALSGGHLASHRISERTLRRVFIVVILALASYKAVTLAVARAGL